MMIEFLLKVSYFMLPAYFANMTPVFVKKLNFLNYPIDFNKKLGGKPILGSHKTWRGLFFGTVAGTIIAYIQSLLYNYPSFAGISVIDYSNWQVFGFLLGFGALFGDAAKSFFKRRLGVKPGAKFIPWDQIDYTLGALIFVSIVYVPTWQFALAAIIMNFCIHVIANHLGYYLGLHKVRW